MRKFWKKYSRDISLLVAAFVSIILIVMSVVMLDEYSSELKDQAGVKGLLYATNTSTYLKESVDKYVHDTALAAQILAGGTYDSEVAFAAELRALGRDGRFSRANFGRFFNKGVEYSMGGNTYSKSMEAASVLQLVEERKNDCAGYVVDREHNINAVAFVAPVDNCAYADYK